jgi:hypothetical protein
MKTIQLTKGFSCIVDDEDFEALSLRSWCALVLKGVTYAKRGTGDGPTARVILMHRQILGITDRSMLVDHIDGNGLDNRRANLRVATKSQNAQNQRAKAAGTSSRFKGVYWWTLRGKWCAGAKLNGKHHSFGSFEIEEDAARAYDEGARTLFGEFAHTNFQGQR